MNPSTLLSLALCCGMCCPLLADEAPAKPEGEAGKVPWNRPLADPEIARPIEQAPRREAELETEAIPKEHAGKKVISIVLEDVRHNENGLGVLVTYRVINPTDEAIKFLADNATSPIITLSRNIEGKWVREDFFRRCLTGVQLFAIAGGQSAVFKRELEVEKLPARIGIDFRVGPDEVNQVIWSEKIER